MPGPLLESLLADELPLNYVTIVSLAFTFYDHILTLGMEVCVLDPYI